MSRLILLFSLTFSLLGVIAPAPAGAGSCGIMPMRPMTPMGCRGSMVPVCSCDSRGQNCSWRWVCMG
jgi:hypothetical protein